MPFAGCTADVLHHPLRRRFRMHGFLSHLHSLMVTMSQKSFVPQAAKSVSQELMSDTLEICPGARLLLFGFALFVWTLAAWPLSFGLVFLGAAACHRWQTRGCQLFRLANTKLGILDSTK